MKKYKIIAWLIIILKSIFFIPVNVISGMNGKTINGEKYMFLPQYLFQNNGCCDWPSYHINVLRFFIEYIVLGLILFLIYLLVKKNLKNKIFMKIVSVLTTIFFIILFFYLVVVLYALFLYYFAIPFYS